MHTTPESGLKLPSNTFMFGLDRSRYIQLNDVHKYWWKITFGHIMQLKINQKPVKTASHSMTRSSFWLILLINGHISLFRAESCVVPVQIPSPIMSIFSCYRCFIAFINLQASHGDHTVVLKLITVITLCQKGDWAQRWDRGESVGKFI